MIILLINFNTTFVHVEPVLFVALKSVQVYFNTTFVHVEQYASYQEYHANINFNTTFVHVELTLYKNSSVVLGFQYNICTCGAIFSSDNYLIFKISIQHLYMWSWTINRVKITLYSISIQHLYMWSCLISKVLLIKGSYFNTTFVHVELFALYLCLCCLWFQYNICTCGAENTWISVRLRRFQYNICTCGAIISSLLMIKI